jgi:predicted DNA-binding transcriptional regulator YafY
MEFGTYMDNDVDETSRRVVCRGFDGVATSIPFEHSHIDATAIRYSMFSQILQAIAFRRRIHVQHRSLTNPEGLDRSIRPHALIKVSPRWRIRASVAKAQEFKYFNLPRILAVGASEVFGLQSGDQDQVWHQMIYIRLASHPNSRRLKP